MNFKLLILTIMLSSCGVKAPPVAAKENTIPSFIEQTSKQLIETQTASPEEIE